MTDPTSFEICMSKIFLALGEEPPNEHKAISAIRMYSKVCRTKPDTGPTYVINLPGISFRTAGMLESSGIDTLEELLKLSNADLRRIRGIGKSECMQIDKVLARIGKRLIDR